jgi:serine/threonine protein kinase
VLYELLTGTPPFAAESATETMRAVLSEHPTPIRKLDPAIPPKLAQTIDRLLRKSPDERYGSTDEIAYELKHLSAVQVELDVKSPEAQLGVTLDGLLADADDLLADAKAYRTRLRESEEWAKTLIGGAMRQRES